MEKQTDIQLESLKATYPLALKKGIEIGRKGMIKIEDEIKFLESLKTYNWLAKVNKRVSDFKQSLKKLGEKQDGKTRDN